MRRTRGCNTTDIYVPTRAYFPTVPHHLLDVLFECVAVIALCMQIEPTQYGIIDLSKASSSDSPVVTAATLTPGSSSSSTTSSATSAGRVGYLKLITFSSNAPQAVAEALLNMQREASQQPGGPLSGLIVDLRDNTGGIVEAGVAIAQVCVFLFVCSVWTAASTVIVGHLC